MTRDAQRLAIAEECGWEFIGERDAYIGGMLQAVPESWRHIESDREVWDQNDLPDYLRDKDLIMDVIEALPVPEQRAIAKLVVARVGDDYEAATAADMAEAFLRVKGRWK